MYQKMQMEKAWAIYSKGYFSEIGMILKIVITRKFEVGISSNFYIA